MNDVGLGDLFVRMLISLAVVLGIVLGAYAVVKRRRGVGQASGGGRSLIARTGRARSGGRNGLASSAGPVSRARRAWSPSSSPSRSC